MKQTPLKRKTPLRAKTVSSQRKPMKRSQPRRDWAAARAKVEAEGNRCRICGQGPAEAAHVIGRKYDQPAPCKCCDGEPRFVHLGKLETCQHCEGTGLRAGRDLWVNPLHVVPLCKRHHRAFDAHELDLLGALSYDEEAEATRLVGLENARRRVCPSEYGNG